MTVHIVLFLLIVMPLVVLWFVIAKILEERRKFKEMIAQIGAKGPSRVIHFEREHDGD